MDNPDLKALPDLAEGASPAAYQIDGHEQLYRSNLTLNVSRPPIMAAFSPVETVTIRFASRALG